MKEKATLWRMKTEKHLCPFGLLAKDLLRRKGFQVEDRLLQSREEVDAFKAEHGVETTPQVIIEGQRVGGYDALRRHFDLPPLGSQSRYTPIIVILVTSLLAAMALTWKTHGTLLDPQLIMGFIGIAMVVLAIQKLQDISSFVLQFVTYDLLAGRWPAYAAFYPFAEAYTGLGMLAGLPAWLVAPVGILIGTIGALSVVKAVYLDKRDLKCACVGGNREVPLGFISLTENLCMVGAGVWMFLGLSS